MTIAVDLGRKAAKQTNMKIRLLPKNKSRWKEPMTKVVTGRKAFTEVL